MKVNVTNILLGALILLLVWQNFLQKPVEKEPVPITVTIPEYKGSTGQKVIERVITQPVYLPSTKETVQVDSGWKKKYEQAQDSLEKNKLYLEAIKIKKYEKTLVDNDTIQIKGFATTRGSLLDYTVDYRIKPISLSYVPEVVTKRPTLSAGFGVEGGIPTLPNTSFLLKGNFKLENSKGNSINVGYDTENRFWIGINKTFKIIK